jgi:integrase
VLAPDGGRVRVSRHTKLADTPANRKKLNQVADVVSSLLAAGKGLEDIDRVLGRAPRPVRATASALAPPPSGPTVRSYYEDWIEGRRLVTRPEELKKYRQRFRRHVLPLFGKRELSTLAPIDMRAFQAKLLAEVSIKTAQNILSAFRAMLKLAVRDALASEALLAELDWPENAIAEPDPLTAGERKKVLEWFAGASFGLPPLKGSTDTRWLPHPPFHAYVLTLFWTGMRPSEASGLHVGDVDLERGLAFIRRSRHGYHEGNPKTRSARRTVELFPLLVDAMRAIIPRDSSASAPLFLNTKGRAIEPHKFSDHWHRGLRETGVRQRGLYCTKDTFVTASMMLNRPPAWLEGQTGVAWATLRRHYARWLHGEGESAMEAFRRLDPSLFGKVRNGPVRVDRSKQSKESRVEAGGIEPRSRRTVSSSDSLPDTLRKAPKRAERTGRSTARKAGNGDE